MRLTIDSHPLLDLHGFITNFPHPLGESPSPPSLQALLSLQAAAPLRSDDATREVVRALLKHGGFKAAGRSKPSSEYLIRAAGDGSLKSINLAVDACNVVSLHSGLPISVIDVARARPPFHVAVAAKDTSFVFNASGQVIDLSGLLCLFDADGPCANAVKDAQRTKTTADTRQTLSLLWGTHKLPALAERAAAWYRELLREAGAETTELELTMNAVS